jgi:selenide,water dikinase
MAAGSNVTIEIDTNGLPIISGVLEMAARNRSGGMSTNKDHFSPAIQFRAGIPDERRDLVFDPQTSGGLLISVSPEAAERTMANLSKAEIPAVFVGAVRPKAGSLVVFG